MLAALERNKKFLRGEIAHRINLKFAPDIRFRIDERFDEAERIEKLLRTPEVGRDLKDERERETKKNEHARTPINDNAGAEAAAPEAEKRSSATKRDVHGWIVLDKPVGMTSTHAVASSSGCSPPSAPAMPARSIRSPPAACRSRSARRPRPFRS